MARKPTILGDAKYGDPNSDLAVQHRLNWLRERPPAPFGGVVYVPRSWVDKDRALQKAVLEMDWLRVDEGT